MMRTNPTILAWRIADTDTTPTLKSKRKLKLLVKQRRSMHPKRRRAMATALRDIAEQASSYAKKLDPPTPKLVRQRINAAEEEITKAAREYFRATPTKRRA
jgi:hypothetical protein